MEAPNKDWTIHNGNEPIARFNMLATQDVAPNNPLQFVFNQMDSTIGHKLKYMLISPHTKPNPKGFRHAADR